MRTYLIKRLLAAAGTLLGVSFLVFSLVRFIPGDPASVVLGEASGTEEQRQEIRRQLGVDKPFLTQYALWLSKAVRGDLGASFTSGAPVTRELRIRLPVTAELALLAFAFAAMIGIPAGVIAATRPGTLSDYLARLAAIVGLSVPGFWIATLIVVLPAVSFGWSPPVQYKPLFEDPAANLQKFIPAAFAIGVALSASVMRMTRSSLLEVMRQDYIRTARAKGLRERFVVRRHGLRNALIPVVTIMGVQAGALLGGAVIIEQIFSMPGVGRLTFEAIGRRDYTQLQANVLFIGMVFVLINLLVDLTYAWLDPRISYT
ncbi:MAG: ABC transporter permease [Dehalococcoidia bacterium]